MFERVLLIFCLIGSPVFADGIYREMRDSVVERAKECFLPEKTPAHICIENVRLECLREFREGRWASAITDINYCTGFLNSYVNTQLQVEISRNLEWATRDSYTMSSSTRGTFRRLLIAEADWQEFTQSYCTALTSRYGAGTATGVYRQLCHLRMNTKRVVEMRALAPETLTVGDFLKE